MKMLIVITLLSSVFFDLKESDPRLIWDDACDYLIDLLLTLDFLSIYILLIWMEKFW